MIEEPYFRHDGRPSVSRPGMAATFVPNYIYKNDLTHKKKIAIRKFSVFPTVRYFEVSFTINVTGEDKTFEIEILCEPGDKMSSDILHEAFDGINEKIYDEYYIEPTEDEPAPVQLVTRNTLEYWLRGSTLEIKSELHGTLVLKSEAMMLLNQPPVITYVTDPLTGRTDTVETMPDKTIDLTAGVSAFLYNVWDRERLFLHASFSQANNNYVCEMDESFLVLNKEYLFDSADFDIWFSLDGRTPFKIYHDNYLFEISYQIGGKSE